MKKYLDIKTIKVSNLVAEYMIKKFFQENSPSLFKKEFVKIFEIEKLINDYLRQIDEDEVNLYIKEHRKLDYKSRPCFAFISDNLTNPLRLYLDQHTEGESVCVDDFSLASDYYTQDLETNKNIMDVK